MRSHGPKEEYKVTTWSRSLRSTRRSAEHLHQGGIGDEAAGTGESHIALDWFLPATPFDSFASAALSQRCIYLDSPATFTIIKPNHQQYKYPLTIVLLPSLDEAVFRTYARTLTRLFCNTSSKRSHAFSDTSITGLAGEAGGRLAGTGDSALRTIKLTRPITSRTGASRRSSRTSNQSSIGHSTPSERPGHRETARKTSWRTATADLKPRLLTMSQRSWLGEDFVTKDQMEHHKTLYSRIDGPKEDSAYQALYKPSTRKIPPKAASVEVDRRRLRGSTR